MAELTPLDEKLGEVLGLAQAAQAATKKVSSMEGADDFAGDLQRMREEARETERRTAALVDALAGKKTAIRGKARETKSEAAEMMGIYLGDEEEALDGFEFLSMAEAGELAHWEIVEEMSGKVGDKRVRDLAGWAVGVQRKHVEAVRKGSLALAAEEVQAVTA
jgi:myo-inositol-hexaphosphate 3-phosphohydrolase